MQRTLIAFAAAAICTLVPSATMQAQGLAEVYQIPFSFNARGLELASGRYTMAKGSTHYKTLSSSKAGVYIMTNPSLSGHPGAARLVFHKYGDKYFLAQVWNADGTGTAVPVSKEERQITRSQEQAKANTAEVTLIAQR
jgi:hypothetical protein